MDDLDELYAAEDDPETIDRREYRIEALRAASRIAAGAVSIKNQPFLDTDGKEVTIHIWTQELAEYLAHWLEAGER